MNFWEQVKKDLTKGSKEVMSALKEGATVVKEKAGELSDEGKRQYKVYDLKSKVHKEIGELGGAVYDLSSKVKNPMLDTKVTAIISKIKKLELQISRIEGKKEIASKKVPVSKTPKNRTK